MNIKDKIKGGEQATFKPTPTPPVISEEKKAEISNEIAGQMDEERKFLDDVNVKQGYDKVFEVLRADNDEKVKQKQVELEDKRRNRKRLFNSIGDGIAALSNLYFTTQGAPSVQYDPRSSLSARSQARWDEMDKIRNAEEQKQYMRDIQQRQMDLNLAIQQQREKRYAQQLAQQKERDDALAKYREDSLATRNAIAEQNALLKKLGIESSERKNESDNQTKITTTAMRGSSSSSGRASSVTPIYLNSGEVINVPKNALSDNKNKSAIYNALPDSVKTEAFQRYNLGEYTKKKQLTPAQMDVIVGEYITHPEAVEAQRILRELAGEQGQPKSRRDKYRVNTNGSADSTSPNTAKQKRDYSEHKE